MVPTHDTVTILGVVLVGSKAARSEFKLDPDAFLPIHRVTIGDAIGVGRANLFDAELQPGLFEKTLDTLVVSPLRAG